MSFEPEPAASAFAKPLLSVPVVSRHGIFFWCLRSLVRVRYTFFLVALLMAGHRQPSGAFVWIVVSFAAILLHELGHALAARLYRAEPAIEIYTLGGVTSWSWPRPPTLTQQVVTSLAGPGIGFVAGGALLATLRAAPPTSLPPLVSLALSDFLWVTLAWGVFNLLPMLPLDGGRTMEALLQKGLGTSKGRYAALGASCLVATLAAAAAMFFGQTYVTVLCALLAYTNFQRLRGLAELPAA